VRREETHQVVILSYQISHVLPRSPNVRLLND
jgi:hypothetical protein